MEATLSQDAARSPQKTTVYSDKSGAPPGLPFGPWVSLSGGKRARTDEDRAFLSDAFKVKAGGASATALYRCLAFYSSLTERRIAYPSQSTMAGYCDMSARQVRRLLSKLLSDGWIVCVDRKSGRAPSTYQLAQRGHDVHVNEDIMSYKEGRQVTKKTLSLRVDAQTIDPSEQEVDCAILPSQEQKQEKAPVPKAPEPVFQNRRQVGMLCAVARKLGYVLSDEQALRFDAVDHERKKAILDRLLAEEQEKALRGEVEGPPKKRAPRADVVISKPKPAPERLCAGEHRWTAAADDGIRNCLYCAAEHAAPAKFKKRSRSGDSGRSSWASSG